MTNTATKPSAPLLPRATSAAAIMLAFAMVAASPAAAQEQAPSAPQAASETGFAIGACAAKPAIAAHFLDSGYEPTAYGMTHTGRQGMMLLTRDDTNADVPSNGQDWVILDVAQSRSCVAFQGSASMDTFYAADSIEANVRPEYNGNAPTVIPAAFAPLPPVQRACTTLDLVDDTLEEDLGLVRVFTGAMDNGTNAVLYAPHFRTEEQSGGRFLLTVEDQAANTSCRVVLGVDYHKVKPAP